jgi:hypothetical protein
MEPLTQALDAIEGTGATGSGDLLDQYRSLRPALHDLVIALRGRGGDWARVGSVLENVLAGADSLASGAVDTFVNVAGTVDDPTVDDPMGVDNDNDDPAASTAADRAPANQI